MNDLILKTHPSWHKILEKSCQYLDNEIVNLINSNEFLPGKKNIFAAFEMPINKVDHILFGESPYPREESAIGHAFIDGNVESLWSNKGLSKQANRATSLRNFIKMLLVAEKVIEPDKTTGKYLENIDKTNYIQSILELKDNFSKNGIMLLNASLVFTEKKNVKKEAKLFKPFLKSLLEELHKVKPNINLILFGSIAKEINDFNYELGFTTIQTEHPYNISFINNETAIAFFKKFRLLYR